MDTVMLILLLLLMLFYSKAWGPYDSFATTVVLLFGLGLVATAPAMAGPQEPDTFDERDTRVFKAVACTKDSKPMEALYYVVASRSDSSAGKPSPSAQLMKDEVENNWRTILSQLTMEQVIEERFADGYHLLLTKMIHRLQQSVEEKSGVSIAVSEINTRPMDSAKDQDVPTCAQL
jgi:hypothetical protein